MTKVSNMNNARTTREDCHREEHGEDIASCCHKWGYPNSRMVYMEKTRKTHQKMDDLGVPPLMETP